MNSKPVNRFEPYGLLVSTFNNIYGKFIQRINLYKFSGNMRKITR